MCAAGIAIHASFSCTLALSLTLTLPRGCAVGEMFVCAAGIAIHAVDPSPDWWRGLLLACVIPDVLPEFFSQNVLIKWFL